VITSQSVAGAVAAVLRHLFAVGEPAKAAYAAGRAPVIERDQDGSALSPLSVTHIQEVMLEQAGIEPGMRVLEGRLGRLQRRADRRTRRRRWDSGLGGH
jgi:protein-L-isoaspartate(D-aspartate) O-methyltransferase